MDVEGHDFAVMVSSQCDIDGKIGGLKSENSRGGKLRFVNALHLRTFVTGIINDGFDRTCDISLIGGPCYLSHRDLMSCAYTLRNVSSQ